MADLERIKGNVGKMLSANAPQADIEAYLKVEGVTSAQLRGEESAFKSGARTFLREGLPFAGALVGAAPGLATLVTPAAAASPWLTPGGAALGAAGGKAAGQFLEAQLLGPAPGERPQTIPEELGDVAMAGATAGMGEAGGQALAKGVTSAIASPIGQKIVAPFRGAITELGEAAQKASEQFDFPLSPDRITPGSWVSRWMTKIGENTPVSSWVVQSQRKKTAQGILRMRDQVIEDVLGLPAKGQGAALKEAKNLAYDALDEAVGVMPGKDLKFELPNTMRYLSENGMASLPKSKLTKDAVKKVMVEAAESGGQVSWQTAKDLRSKLWGNVGNKSVFGKLAPEEIGSRQALAEAIEQDFRLIGDTVDADLPALATAAKAKYLDFKAAEKSDLIEKLLAKATRVNEDGTTMFMPSLFKQELSKSNKALEAAFKYGDAEVLTRLRSWADMMEVVGVDQGRMLMRQAQGATRPLAEAAAVMGGSAARSVPALAAIPGASAVLPVVLPVFSGFESVVAYSMMKPNGAVKKWLTTGLGHGDLFKAIEKEGTKGLLMKMNELDQQKRRK